MGFKTKIQAALVMGMLMALVFSFTALSLTGCSNPTGHSGPGGGGDGGGDTDTGISVSALEPFGALTSPYTQPAEQTVTVTSQTTEAVTLTQPSAVNYEIGTLSTDVLASKGATATFTVRPKAGLTAETYEETITVSGTGGVSAEVNAIFIVMTAEGPFTGAGTFESPYQISTAAQLATMRDLVNMGEAPYAESGTYYKLIFNINLSGPLYSTGAGWAPIGTYAPNAPFRGTFDGGDYTISNLTINRTSDYNGLFGYVSGGTIKNLGLANVDIAGGGNNGGVAGRIENSTVSSCYVSGKVRGNGNATGGLVGVNVGDSTVINCYTTAELRGNERVGGIVGSNSSTITNCYATGPVYGDNYLGGIVGYNGGTITGCLALNPFIIKNSGAGTFINRVAGYGPAGVSNNAAFAGMEAVGDFYFSTQFEELLGTNMNALSARTQGTYSSSPYNWKFGDDENNPWKWGTGVNAAYELPVLYWQNTTPAPSTLEHLSKAAPFAGAGTFGNPYQIATPAQLAMMRTLINAGAAPYAESGQYYKLIADIDLGVPPYNTGAGWTPIGYYQGTNTNPFRGDFDGNGCRIFGLTINRATVNSLGLFGYAEGATIRNLSVIDVNISSAVNYTGAVAGITRNSSIINCYVSGIVKGGESYTGGVAGQINGGSIITNCYSAAAVQGGAYTGGVTGSISSANGGGTTVSCCYATGAVSGSSYTGGIAGQLFSSGSIYYTYLKSCVALNPSITCSPTGTVSNFGRVVGSTNSGNDIISDNRAWQDMTALGGIWFAAGAAGNSNGLNMTTAQAKLAINYSSSPYDWKFGLSEASPWQILGTGKLPTLYNQYYDVPIPAHLQ